MVSVPENMNSFRQQQFMLFHGSKTIAMWADFPHSIDYPLPGNIRPVRKSSQGKSNHLGGTSTNQTCNLTVSGNLAIGDLSDRVIDPLKIRGWSSVFLSSQTGKYLCSVEDIRAKAWVFEKDFAFFEEIDQGHKRIADNPKIGFCFMPATWIQ